MIPMGTPIGFPMEIKYLVTVGFAIAVCEFLFPVSTRQTWGAIFCFGRFWDIFGKITPPEGTPTTKEQSFYEKSPQNNTF